MSTLRPPNSHPTPAPPHPVAGHAATGASKAGAATESISVRDLLLVLRRHVVLVLGAVAACLALTAFVVLRQPPRYRATAVVQLTEARQSITHAIEYRDERSRASDAPLSHIQVLKSRAVIGTVVDSEGLRLRPDTRGVSPALLTHAQVEPAVLEDTFVVSFSKAAMTVRNGARTTEVPYGMPYRSAGVSFVVPSNPGIPQARFVIAPREQTIDGVLQNLRVAPRGETNVVDVSYVDGIPTVAQRAVNRLVRTFQDVNVRAAQSESRRRRLFLEEQLREIDAQLARAQKALTSFRSREQVFSSRGKLEAQQSALMTLDMRREEVDADRRMYQSLLAKLQGPRSEQKYEELRALLAVPDLSSNPVISQLYQQLTQYQTARDSLTTGEWRSAASNPDVARLDQLIKGTEQRLVAAVNGHIATLDARLSALGTLRERGAAAVEALPRTESMEEQLVRQVDANRTLADRLSEEYQKARMAEVVEAGQVDIVDSASVPYAPIGDMRSLKLLLGLAMGLVIGGGAAMLIDGANARVRRRADLEDELRVPVLSIIPKIEAPAVRGELGRRLAATLRGPRAKNDAQASMPRYAPTVPMSPAGSEAFRLLRSSLKWSQGEGSSHTLVVTSAMAQEGKTTTSTNLAAAFALEGQRVLLIDCDLRRTRLHRAFRVPRHPGLVQVLRGLLTPAAAIRSTFIAGLYFLPAGGDAETAADLLGSDRMRSVLEELSGFFTVIVLDTPPVLAVADAVTLAPLTDGVLLVVRAGSTDRRAVRQTLQQLTSVGAGVVGAVLNDSSGEVRSYEEYYYSEDYAAVAE